MSSLSPASPTELRHITSTTNLSPARERRLSNRNSQHLRTHRLGSRSPASIPSSPTSVHSSSSAIFERDIEPINQSPTNYPSSSDPHRIPRGRMSEQLDQSVPSVLDSAAAVLASGSPADDDLDSISILAPSAPDGYQSGVTSPISRLSSRSPSPSGAANRRSLLFSTSPLTGSPPTRPTVHTHTQVPAPLPLPAAATSATAMATATATATPTSQYFSVPPSEAGSEASSPTTATHHEHPLHTLPPPAPPSPKAPAKRLSFLSYMDLLGSIPASTLPLSSLTSSAQASEPPPHLPSVLGVPQAQFAAAGSSAASIHGALGILDRDALRDDVGGEWEREGLGRGLEERLELLNALPSKA